MSFLSNFSKIFSIVQRVVSLIDAAMNTAKAGGLSDDIVQLALGWVKAAALQQLAIPARREWIIKAIMARGIQESVARIATEMAFMLAQSQLAKVPDLPAIP